VETHESAVSRRTHKMPSLEQRTDGLQWLELTTTYEVNVQKESP